MNAVLAKYNARAEAANSLLCVGLDPDMDRMPARFHGETFPLFAFGRFIIEQTAPFASAFKPNTAFYEAQGAAGVAELQMTCDYLRAEFPEHLLICDAKRADIGNTNRGYATFAFDALGCDAVTLHPYLGGEAMRPFLERADKGCIFLCRTSNAGAGDLQDLSVAGKPLWQVVAEKVTREWDTKGNCMLVVGATYPEEMRALRGLAAETTFLVPGLGAQGGDVAAVVAAGLDAQGKGLILSCSRDILYAADAGAAAREFRDAINIARDAVHIARDAVRAARDAREAMHAAR